MAARWFALPLALILSCQPASRSADGSRPITPREEPLPAEVPAEIAPHIAALGADDFAARERGTQELRRLASDPARQPAVVDALRAAATSRDAEQRHRAGDLLRDIDRSESLVPGYERTEPNTTMTVTLADSTMLHVRLWWYRAFADGYAEAEVEVGGARELFSGSSLAELARKLNEAARERGYGEADFLAKEDGSVRIGGATFSMPPAVTVPGWDIAVARATREDGRSPRAAWGGWIVQARSVRGRAFAHGLQLRDVIMRIDGAAPATHEELRRALEGAGTIEVLRPEGKLLPIRAR